MSHKFSDRISDFAVTGDRILSPLLMLAALGMGLVSGTANARELTCKPLSRVASQGVAGAALEFLDRHVWWGDLDARLADNQPLGGTRILQQCTDAQNRFEGLTVSAVVEVRVGHRSRLTPFYCLARIKRLKGFRTDRDRWGEWLHVGSRCKTDPHFVGVNPVRELPPYREPSRGGLPGSAPGAGGDAETRSERGLPYLDGCNSARCIIGSPLSRDSRTWDEPSSPDSRPSAPNDGSPGRSPDGSSGRDDGSPEIDRGGRDGADGVDR